MLVVDVIFLEVFQMVLGEVSILIFLYGVYFLFELK